MPYSNFDDTNLFSSLFNRCQQDDTDMNIGEFIFEKLLVVGEMFEGDEEEDPPAPPHQHQQEPLQVQMPQSGSLFCLKIFNLEKNREPIIEKPTCLFREDKFSSDFHALIFHPPALLAS